jgi:ribosomal-protein-alanine N-acetyltransferase
MLTHKGTQTLTTERLVLRRLTPADADAAFANWLSDEKTSRYVRWETYTDIEKVREYLEKCVADYEKPEHYHWAIEYSGEIIGTINLHNLADKSERCELGYCIGSKWWGRGIVAEAVIAVMTFAFAELNMYKIGALHDVENAASGRVMQKCGMTQEALFKEHSHRRDGVYGDVAYYSIFKRDWKSPGKSR